MKMRSLAKQLITRAAYQAVRTSPRKLWLIDRLESRLMFAAFTGANSTLALALAGNEAAAITATSDAYTLNLTGGSWSGTNDGNVSGDGSATLTVKKNAFDLISIADGNGTGASVAFKDSTTNSYDDSFSVALTNAAAGPVAFDGTTRFTGPNALSAATTASIVANPNSSITTASGGITLSANQQATPRTGPFVGIDVNGATVQSAAGAVSLAGRGGTTGTNNVGVAIRAGGKVQETGAAPALISITGSANDGASAAIALDGGAVSTVGSVTLTANGGTITQAAGAGPAVTAADGAKFATTGSNSAIGTSANPLRTAIGALTATTNDGGVHVADSNGPGLIINSVLALQGGSPAVINGSNKVVLANPDGTTAVGTNDVSVTATGDVLLTSGTGVSTTVVAPDAVTITSSGGRVLQGKAGTVNVLARTANLTASGSAGVAGGAIGLTVENFSASTANGSIYLAELIPGTATSVVAGGAGNSASVTGSGTTLGIGTITAQGTVTLEQTGGALVGGAGTLITGQAAVLTGKSGIGTAAAPFKVTAGSVSATVTDPGVPIHVTSTTALTSVSATTNNGDAAIQYTGGALSFTASSGLLTASGPATVSFGNTGGDVTFGAVRAASITASGAIIAAPSVALTGDTVTLTAGTGIGAVGSPIKTSVTTLNATTTRGPIVVSQSGAFTLNAKSLGFTDTGSSAGSDINVATTTGTMTVGVVSALGTVTLGAGGGVLAGSLAGTASASNVSAASLALTAANGIGTTGAVLQTSVDTLAANAGAGGLVLANNKALKLTSASATGGGVSVNAVGDLAVGPVTATGQAVTLSATGALTDSNGAALNVAAQSATLRGSSIGSSSDPFETNVSSLTATGTSGAIYVSDLGAGPVTLTAAAAGQGSNINFTGAGSVVLTTVTAKGNTVTLNAAGSITNGLGVPGVNITAQTLSINALSGIGTLANPLQILVAQIAAADGGAPGAFMTNAGAVSIAGGALQAPGSGTLTFSAASITVLDMGGTTATLAAGRSLVLTTSTGPIVFLNPADTIRTTGAGTITVAAGTVAGSAGVAALGNLTTAGGEIKVTADASITIGQLNAGAGNVTVQSARGIILDGNGPSALNVIAGTATLSGNAPTARQLDLDEVTKIAAAAAASAQASAELTSADAFGVQLAAIMAEVAKEIAVVAVDQTNADAANEEYERQQEIVDALAITSAVLNISAAAANTAYLVANAIAGPAQAVPLTGDFGAQTVAVVLNVIAVALGDAAAVIGVSLTAESIELTKLANRSSEADARLIANTSTLGLAKAMSDALDDSVSIARSAAANSQLQSLTAQVVANQAIAARDQANVIGTASSPLGLQVTRAVNVTAGPSDSYLQVAGDTALNQIIATGSVTLISTGAITNGAAPGVPNIVATGLTIKAANGIGTAAHPLVTRVGTLNATNTGGGDIVISNTAAAPAALDITGVTNAGGGNVVLSSAGNAAAGQGLTVSGPVARSPPPGPGP